MIGIGEVLLPDRVNLALSSTEKAEAINEVVIRLRGDSRVIDWDVLDKAVLERDAPAIVSCGQGLCIAHGRTNAVSTLVMAAGRSDSGISFPGVDVPVRLIFVAGIPGPMSSEYLRLMGVIVRVCRDERLFQKILSAKDTAKFVEIFQSEENRLT
ncbi:MAG: PTS sugar transporter subunit IIA [Chthoniobacterales bacterium]